MAAGMRQDEAPRLPTSSGHPVALLLGSGFGGLAGLVKPIRRVSYESMEGYERPTDIAPERVPQVTVGTIDGSPVVVYPTRLHLYHGHTAYQVTAPVRHAYASGCRVIVCIGASGLVDGADDQALGVVSDHLNLTNENPLIGWRPTGVQHGGALTQQASRPTDAFVPMDQAYDLGLRGLAHEVARERGIDLCEGVYAEVRGPSLETPAEVRALRMLGVTYVGMSLSLEVIMARALGMRVLALTLPTNPAGAAWVSHRSVRAEATSATRELEAIVRGVLARLG
ncbi:MAG: purine-nucleoside phosphorylase [Atopobiaceae bacterium]|nr:purine-nucleoside phosphorylase [Atopobiaceae bacterium]